MLQSKITSSRTKAKTLIAAKKVFIEGQVANKSGHMVAENEKIEIKQTETQYVSRGGIKLKKAIDMWPSRIGNSTCLDVGASTGGFSDVLLKEGALLVYAVDVGYGQLAWELRNHKKIINLERTHILKINENIFVPKPTIVAIDLSFISITKVLPSIISYSAKGSTIYALIKPQFELSRSKITKKGIVKERSFREEALQNVLNYSKRLGLTLVGYDESPITGSSGNIEFISSFKAP